MKKVLSLALAMLFVLALFAGCSSAPSADGSLDTSVATDRTEGIAKEDLKVGVVHIMELGDQGYTFNHDQGTKQMLETLDLSEDQYIPKFNIDDQDDAAVTAALNELVQAGCQIVFATSFSYGPQVVEVAKANPDVEFCHATGTDAHTAGLPNLHNYFAKVHQARYLAGIAAGMKTEANKLGYVAAYPFAEVISGFTAFYLGAKSVNPDVTMDVIYIESWGDSEKERQVTEALAERGCDVISQHSDSISPALAAEDKGVFHVGYNNDMAPAAPNASLISARINWGIYMTEAVEAMINGEPIPVDWGKGIDSGACYLSDLNTDIAADGTQEAIDEATKEIEDGMLIFKGALKDNEGNPAVVTDFDDNEIFVFEDEDSSFVESDEFSAPAFNAIIEGIFIV